MQSLILIDATYTDPIHGHLHVVVSRPYGGGEGFHVNINNYFYGPIVKYNTGWTSAVKLGVLNQDDIDAIMDAILAWEKSEQL